MSYITDELLEETEEYIHEAAERLFNEYSLLESFHWEQGFDEEGDQHCAEDFEVNDGAYYGEDRLWRHNVCNQLRWAFDSLESENLLALYGKNVRVTVTRDGTEITTLG